MGFSGKLQPMPSYLTIACACAFLVVLPFNPAGAATPQPTAVAHRVDCIIIYKARKVMQLLKNDEVVRSYRIAIGNNSIGSKRKAGDCRTPEGGYVIDRHNTQSAFYKSVHISYPNAKDVATARQEGHLARGNIMIHGLPKDYEDLGNVHYGRNWTKGCIAINNKEMDELWDLVPDGTPIEIKP